MLDFTPGSFGVLTLIRANPGITQVALAAAFGVDKSTMSPVIVRLEKRGLVRREVLASDRRCHALYLEASAEPQFLAAREKVRAFEGERGLAPLQARAARAGAPAGQAAGRRGVSVTKTPKHDPLQRNDLQDGDWGLSICKATDTTVLDSPSSSAKHPRIELRNRRTSCRPVTQARD